LGEPFQDLPRRERSRTGGGELDREREVIETIAKLNDLSRSFEPGALAEERDRLGGCERRHLVLNLALHAQEFATRAKQAEVRAGPKET